MTKLSILLLAATAAATLVAAIGFSLTSGQAAGRSAFGFKGTLSGFPTGAAFLTGVAPMIRRPLPIPQELPQWSTRPEISVALLMSTRAP